jgi:hypothetical protein
MSVCQHYFLYLNARFLNKHFFSSYRNTVLHNKLHKRRCAGISVLTVKLSKEQRRGHIRKSVGQALGTRLGLGKDRDANKSQQIERIK